MAEPAKTALAVPLRPPTERHWRRVALLAPAALALWALLLAGFAAMLAAPAAVSRNTAIELSMADASGGATGAGLAAGTGLAQAFDKDASSAGRASAERTRLKEVRSVERPSRALPAARPSAAKKKIARRSTPPPHARPSPYARAGTAAADDARAAPDHFASAASTSDLPAAAAASDGSARIDSAIVTGATAGSKERGSAMTASLGSSSSDGTGPGAGDSEMHAGAGNIAAVRAIYAPLPTIPDDLREQALDTFVVARFSVAADGHAAVSLVKRTANRRLDALVLGALRRWRFQPATRDGKPIAAAAEMKIEIEVR